MSESGIEKDPLSIDEFRKVLSKQNKLYLLFTGLPANKVLVQFEGRFENKSVVWKACIRTVEDYSRNHPVSDDPSQFIDIKIENNIFNLEVALNIYQIDQAVIERTIIMIRKYKKLKAGRHEYCVRSKIK